MSGAGWLTHRARERYPDVRCRLSLVYHRAHFRNRVPSVSKRPKAELRWRGVRSGAQGNTALRVARGHLLTARCVTDSLPLPASPPACAFNASLHYARPLRKSMPFTAIQHNLSSTDNKSVNMLDGGWLLAMFAQLGERSGIRYLRITISCYAST